MIHSNKINNWSVCHFVGANIEKFWTDIDGIFAGMPIDRACGYYKSRALCNEWSGLHFIPKMIMFRV